MCAPVVQCLYVCLTKICTLSYLHTYLESKLHGHRVTLLVLPWWCIYVLVYVVVFVLVDEMRRAYRVQYYKCDRSLGSHLQGEVRLVFTVKHRANRINKMINATRRACAGLVAITGHVRSKYELYFTQLVIVKLPLSRDYRCIIGRHRLIILCTTNAPSRGCTVCSR